MSTGQLVPLTGLCGDNPLAFLAALGTLRTLTSLWPERSVQLSWTADNGVWQPALRIRGGCHQDQLVDELSKALAASESDLPEWKDVPVSVDAFRAAIRNAFPSATTHRPALDVFAWLGSDLTLDRKDDAIAVTLFKMVSGQQSFLGQIRELIRETERHHLEEALFGTWAYRDRKPSMRWDPVDDRRYALRASDPADTNKSPILTVRGANRLAIQALALYPVIPTRKGAVTRGFLKGRSRWMLTWPIWSESVGLDTVRSLVSHPDLLAVKPSADRLRPLGIVEVFRSERTTAYYSNFYPAQALWGAIRG